MTPRKPNVWGYKHLAQVEAEHGTGALSPGFRALMQMGQDVLNEQHDQERIEEKGSLIPSNTYMSEADNCPRQTAYKLTGAPETNPSTVDSLANMALGNKVEELVEERLRAAGCEVEREIPVEIDFRGFRVSGRVDALVELPDELAAVTRLPKKAPWELKMTNIFTYKFMVENREPGKPGHRKQANLYLAASQRGQLDRAYDLAVLCYVIAGATRGTPMFHAFPVAYDEGMAHADLANLTMIHKMAEASDIPNIPIDYIQQRNKTGRLPNYPCANYCAFRDHCWGQQRAAEAVTA